MPGTTTIRIDRETHERLRRISTATGHQLIDVVRQATDALERAEFAKRVRDDVAALRADEEAWADYVTDFERLPVGDGIV